MYTTDDRQKLVLAAQLVRGVRQHLDKRESTCPHCSTKRKANWTEHQMDEELKAIINKLEKWSKVPDGITDPAAKTE